MDRRRRTLPGGVAMRSLHVAAFMFAIGLAASSGCRFSRDAAASPYLADAAILGAQVIPPPGQGHDESPEGAGTGDGDEGRTSVPPSGGGARDGAAPSMQPPDASVARDGHAGMDANDENDDADAG